MRQCPRDLLALPELLLLTRPQWMLWPKRASRWLLLAFCMCSQNKVSDGKGFIFAWETLPKFKRNKIDLEFQAMFSMFCYTIRLLRYALHL
mmetsp:Transcript_39808/g.68940  ORF Transcript_39808/g.68940 Transcript_39808/m.68940 type:complete len:91 (-) Transcript_39808:58-330(-)